jgi:serine/threonine protein kinase
MRNFQYNIRDFIKDASAKTLAQKLTPPFPTPFTFSEKLEYAHSIVDIFETRCAYYVDTFGRNPKPADIATIATARSIPQFSAVNIFLNPDGAVGMTRERLPNATPDGLAKSIANDDVCVLSPEELIRVYSPKVNRDVRLRIMNGKSGCIQPIVRNSAEPLIKLDTWALGLLLCHIFSNSVRSPFQSIQSIDLEASTPNIIENTFVNEPNLSDVTPVEARTLIGALLHKNPAERPSLEAIRNDPLLRVKWNDKGSFDLARGWERATEGVSGMNPRGVKGLLSASVVDYTPFGTDQARFTRKYKELLPVANADAS